jgi:hypothetical protein
LSLAKSHPSTRFPFCKVRKKEIHLADKKIPCGVLMERPKGDRLDYVGLDERIILKWVLKE